MAGASRTFVTESLQLIRDRLQRLGFDETSEDVYTIDLGTDGIQGWVGLNLATDRGGSVDVNPAIGVVHEELERRVAGLGGGEVEDEAAPSVTVQLGYLTPEGAYRPWRFSPGEDSTAVADALAEAISTHALPFMRKLTDPAELAAAIRTEAFEEARAERLPVMLLIMGDRDAAPAELEDELAAIEGDESEAAAEYRQYAERLEQQLS